MDIAATNVARAVTSSRQPAATNRAAVPAGAALAVEGVDLRFGGIHALRGVSFEAAPGALEPAPYSTAVNKP